MTSVLDMGYAQQFKGGNSIDLFHFSGFYWGHFSGRFCPVLGTSCLILEVYTHNLFKCHNTRLAFWDDFWAKKYYGIAAQVFREDAYIGAAYLRNQKMMAAALSRVLRQNNLDLAELFEALAGGLA